MTRVRIPSRLLAVASGFQTSGIGRKWRREVESSGLHYYHQQIESDFYEVMRGGPSMDHSGSWMQPFFIIISAAAVSSQYFPATRTRSDMSVLISGSIIAPRSLLYGARSIYGAFPSRLSFRDVRGCEQGYETCSIPKKLRNRIEYDKLLENQNSVEPSSRPSEGKVSGSAARKSHEGNLPRAMRAKRARQRARRAAGGATTQIIVASGTL